MTRNRILSRDTVKAKVRPFVKRFWIKNAGKYAGFSDTKYFLATPSEASLLLFSAQLPQIVTGEIFDCEDFAFALKAHVAMMARKTGQFEAPPCIGIAWGRFAWVNKDHACNWILDSTGRFSWIEPQQIALGQHSASFHRLNECRGRLTLLLV